MAQHMGGDGFQPPGQVHERRTACDISLTLCLSAQLLCCALPQLLHCSLRDPLSDSHLYWLPFRRYSDANQKPLPFLVTADGRQSVWAANALKIAAQQTLRVRMKRKAARFPCLAAPDRNRSPSEVEITELQVTHLLGTEPCIDEQG